MKQALAACLLSWSLLSLASVDDRHGANTAKPLKIVSLSLCIDQVLLMLVEKQRIAAITHLAPDPTYSYHWRAAESLTIHNGLAEEIVPLKPDLVIGISNADVMATQMMRRLGLNVHSLPSPTNLREAEVFTRALGKLVGENERAEQLIQTMHRDIARAKALADKLPAQVAISYGPNGYTAGQNTLKNEILTAAGYRNLAAELGIKYYGNVSLEQLVWAKPDIIILDQDGTNQNSKAQSFTNHPVLNSLLGQDNIHRMPTSYWLCPGPIASKAILRLVEQRQ